MTRIGKFEQADRGTIFLDEIGEMPPALQAKLLHVLQDAQFTKLGSNKTVTVDVRVVAATNRRLEEMLISGGFREDLYYRLKVIELTVPPLRERRSEIPDLTEFFIARYTERYKRARRPLSDALQQLFQSYEWPGNIRELENMIKRIVILQDEQLVLRELTTRSTASMTRAAAPPESFEPVGTADVSAIARDQTPPLDRAEPAPPGTRLSDVAKAAASAAERAIIMDTLRSVHWNRRRAANQLGVSYKTLLTKIKECDVAP
jgi:transcriptional regulator with PAS, ATPase and Fis domain